MGVTQLLGRQHFRDIGHAGQMGVHAGEQHGPGRGTVCRCVIVGEAHAFLRQGVERGRTDLAAVRTKISKTEVVRQYQDYIWLL